MKSLLLAAIVCLLVGHTYALTHYTYNFNRRAVGAGTQRPYHDLGYIYQDNTIQVNITLPGVVPYQLSNLVIVLQNKAATPVVKAADTDGCSGAAATALTCSMLYNIGTSDNYVLIITATNQPVGDADLAAPANRAVKLFYLDVRSYLTAFGGPTNSSANIITLKKSTETFRDRVVKLIYVSNSNSVLRFSLWPVDATYAVAGTQNLRLYAVNTITSSGTTFNLNGNDLLNPANNYFDQTFYDANPTSRRYQFTQTCAGCTNRLAIGYYALVVVYTPDNQNPVQVTFDSDSYACPYESVYADTYLNFQPCQHQAANQEGFPCINFDSATLKCLLCFTGYDLINGTCTYNDTCPDRFYFEFGTCLPVNDSCATYDNFTGYCLSCKLNDSTIDGRGNCVPNPVVCADRQYVNNRTCVNISDLCATWDNATGQCKSCITDYTLSNGTCIPIVIVCKITQYLVGKKCIDIPKECVSFDRANQRCAKCINGWWPSSLGVCQQILCPPRQVPSTYGFFCIKVSPLCDHYDNLTGDCLNCTDPDATVVNGKCRHVVNPLAGCQERQRLGYGPCKNALLNCQLYDLVTKNCYKCVAGFFPDYKGECTLKNAVCQSDQVSIRGHCMQMPPHCSKVDGAGLCSQCDTNYTNIFGLCVKVATCTGQQYMNSNGACVDVNPNCKTWNPSTGVCLTCNDGSPATNGLCCSTGQNAFRGQCISSVAWRDQKQAADQASVPTCVAFHPTTAECLQCNGDFRPSRINPKQCV